MCGIKTLSLCVAVVSRDITLPCNIAGLLPFNSKMYFSRCYNRMIVKDSHVLVMVRCGFEKWTRVFAHSVVIQIAGNAQR